MAMSGFDSVVQDLVITAVLEEYDQVARHADSRSSARSNSREQRWRVVTALVFAPDREVRFASDSPVEEADSNRWSHFRVSTTRGPMSPTASIRIALLIPLA